MSRTTKALLIAALAVGLIGAVMVFALEGDAASAGPLNLQALGGVLLAVAVLLMAGGAIAMARPDGGAEVRDDTLRTATGLVAVIAGIVAIGVLTITTISFLDVNGESTEAVVAITTSAFGIVSTVITAYLGIKATANAVNKVAEVNETDPEVEE